MNWNVFLVFISSLALPTTFLLLELKPWRPWSEFKRIHATIYFIWLTNITKSGLSLKRHCGLRWHPQTLIPEYFIRSANWDKFEKKEKMFVCRTVIFPNYWVKADYCEGLCINYDDFCDKFSLGLTINTFFVFLHPVFFHKLLDFWRSIGAEVWKKDFDSFLTF